MLQALFQGAVGVLKKICEYPQSNHKQIPLKNVQICLLQKNTKYPRTERMTNLSSFWQKKELETNPAPCLRIYKDTEEIYTDAM